MTNYVVGSGQSSSGVSLSSGDSIVVNLGGTIANTVLNGGSEADIQFGGVADLTSVGYAALEMVEFGGLASSSILASGAALAVSSGGSAVGTVVSDGGALLVESGGSAVATTVLAGGALVALPGAVVSNTANAGGWVISTGVVEMYGPILLSSAAVQMSGIDEGGALGLYVLPGGSAINIVDSYDLELFGGAAGSAFAIGAEVSGSGGLQVWSGGVTSDTALSAGGFETVNSGGIDAGGTVIGSGASEVVLAGGSASNVAIQAGGALIVTPGAVVTNTVNNGGQVISTGVVLASGGTVLSSAAGTGGFSVSGFMETEFVLSGGSALNPTVTGDVYGNAALAVFNGGIVNGGNVGSNGEIDIYSGGVGYNNKIGYSGTENIYYSGTDRNNSSIYGNINIYSGDIDTSLSAYSGNIFVYNGGVASDVGLSAGAGLDVLSGGVAKSVWGSSNTTIAHLIHPVDARSVLRSFGAVVRGAYFITISDRRCWAFGFSGLGGSGLCPWGITVRQVAVCARDL